MGPVGPVIPQLVKVTDPLVVCAPVGHAALEAAATGPVTVVTALPDPDGPDGVILS